MISVQTRLGAERSPFLLPRFFYSFIPSVPWPAEEEVALKTRSSEGKPYFSSATHSFIDKFIFYKAPTIQRFEAEGSPYFSSATHSFIPSFIVVDSRGGSCPEGPDHPEVRGGGQSLLLLRSTLGRRSYRPCRQQKVLFFHASDPSTINRQKYNFRIFFIREKLFQKHFSG